MSLDRYISLLDSGGSRIFSPDGRHWAVVRNASEFQMNGPMVGNLLVSNGIEEPLCGVSIVWSEDSRFLAAPKLDPRIPEFRILVIRVSDGVRRYAPGRFGPVALAEFHGCLITAVHRSREQMTISLAGIRWD